MRSLQASSSSLIARPPTTHNDFTLSVRLRANDCAMNFVPQFFSRAVLGLLAFFSGEVFGQIERPAEIDEPMVHYYSSEGLEDPVARLQRRVAEGKVTLQFDSGRGYLFSLLKELKVPVSSQALVFSKT